MARLYLTDDNHRQLEMAAAVGKAITEEWQAQAHFPLSGRHPAVTALVEGRTLTARGGEATEDRGLVDRFGLHRYVRVFLPLIAGGEPLGTLELGYGVGRVRLSDEHKRTLGTFADQVAIAVHNMLLLRRTDEALARKLAELSVGREIQLSLLPKTTPIDPRLAVCGNVPGGADRGRRLLRLLRPARLAHAARRGDRGRGGQGRACGACSWRSAARSSGALRSRAAARLRRSCAQISSFWPTARPTCS